MRKELISLAIFSLATSTFAGEILNGAGSSAIAPLIQAWAVEYKQISDVEINYQAVGSGSGIRMVSSRMVDFGATDAPLTPKQLERKKLLQFPIASFGVVLAYNLPFKNLKLSTSAICGIFSGKIKYWDNPIIKKDNENLKLPHKKIVIVVRADKSGTTYTFTSYLVKACKGSIPYLKKPTKKPYWRFIYYTAQKGNSGVATVIQKIPYSLGYVEYTYAVKSGLKIALLQNKEGEFVNPSLDSFAAALKYTDWSPENGFYADLTFKGGKETWPIVGATWALMPEERTKKNKEIIKFFVWAFSKGDTTAKKLFYAPLPLQTKNLVFQYFINYLVSY